MPPKTKARLLLFFTVLVWGSTFVVVKTALADASPLVFNAVRMGLATLILLAVNRRALRGVTRKQMQGGAVTGLFLAAGYQFQTFGLARTTAAKSAFITGLVVVFVPLLTLVPGLRPAGTRRPGLRAVMGALIAFGGLLLLTTPQGTAARDLFSSISAGDLLTLACALAFAGHLLMLGRVSPVIPAGTLATLQIGFAFVFMVLALPLEPLRLHLTPGLLAAWAVTAVLGTAAAFTIQSYAQQHLPPTPTAVILTLEPVFAWLTSLLFLHEHLGRRALAGAALILLAVALIELMPTQNAEIPS